MAGVTTKRCPECSEIALLIDRGRVLPVGETRFLDALANGDIRFRCICGAVLVWSRVKGVVE